MPRRFNFEEGYFYHIYNRGLNKQKIFYDHSDYKKFIHLMAYWEKKYKSCKIIAYCLIPNHFHILIQNHKTGLFFSHFMSKVCGTYAKYFAIKHTKNRGTRLFENNFKCKLLKDEKYKNACHYYVINNAIKHNIVEDISLWPYSSSHLEGKSKSHANIASQEYCFEEFEF